MHFEPAKIESGYCLRHFTLPHGIALPTLIRLADQRAGRSDLHAFWDVERHVVRGIFSKGRAGAVGIPIVPGDGIVVASSFVDNCLFSAVSGGYGVFLADGEGLGENHGKICILFLVFLNKEQFLVILAGNAFNAKGWKKAEWNYPKSVDTGFKSSHGLAG